MKKLSDNKKLDCFTKIPSPQAVPASQVTSLRGAKRRGNPGKLTKSWITSLTTFARNDRKSYFLPLREGIKWRGPLGMVSASQFVILRCQRHSPIRCWYNFKASLRVAKNLKNNKVQLIVPYKTYTYHSK